jgi:hypothetical protein
MNCPFCKSKRVVPYSDRDLVLVIPRVPEAGRLIAFRCENPKCNGTFYALHEMVKKGLKNG